MNSRFASTALAGALLAIAGCAGGTAAGPGAAARPAAPRRDVAAEAYAARQARDFARAEALATQEIDAGRGHARLYFERGVARMELGKNEEALADFRKLLSIQEDPAARLLAGMTELRLSRWEDAEKDLARAVALDPKNDRAWASLAQARIALRDLPGAEAAFQKASALDPADAYVREVGERLDLAKKQAAPAEATPGGPAEATPAGVTPAGATPGAPAGATPGTPAEVTPGAPKAAAPGTSAEATPGAAAPSPQKP